MIVLEILQTLNYKLKGIFILILPYIIKNQSVLKIIYIYIYIISIFVIKYSLS